MDVIDLASGQIIPYARNPRRNEKAVATVAASIAESGQGHPPHRFIPEIPVDTDRRQNW